MILGRLDDHVMTITPMALNTDITIESGLSGLSENDNVVCSVRQVAVGNRIQAGIVIRLEQAKVGRGKPVRTGQTQFVNRKVESVTNNVRSRNESCHDDPFQESGV
jgi:hypothetical protein